MPQSDRETPTPAVPAPQVQLLTPWSQAAARIRSAALSHYVHALVAMTGDYFAEHKPDQGMDLCLAVAVLPEGAALVHGELSPNALPQSGLAEFLDQVQTLPHPPVRGGPVALVVRFPVMGGRQDRLKAGLRNNVPAGFISVLKRAESYFAARLPRPGFWARTIAGCRRALATMRHALSPPAPAKPTPGNDFSLKEEDRTVERLTEMAAKNPHCSKIYLWRAQLHRQQESYEAAIADYSEYLSHNPDDAQAYFERGICHHASSSREKALADYNEALRHNPQAAVVLMRRAWLYIELEALERALQDATAATEIDPWEPEWLLGRAKLFAAGGKFDLALADLDQALQLDPHHMEALFIRAMVYRDRPCPQEQAQADCKLAIAGFTATLFLDRNHVPAYAHRAEMRRHTGDLDGAMADCDQAIRRSPQYGFPYAIRGHVHLCQGDRRQAIDDCTEAVRLGTDGWLVQLTLADAHLGENELDEALAACEAALKLSPQHPGGLLLRAKTQMQMGLLDAAVDDASAAIDAAPAWHEGYAVRGNLHGLRGDTAKALTDLNEALRLEPADVVARYNRGVAWFHDQEFARALADFDEAERLGCNAAMLYFMRATVYLHQSEPERALGDLDEALRQDPECAPALGARANLLLHIGRHADAMRDYNELVRLCPNVAAAYSSRASAWLQMGEQEKAAADFQEAVQLDPGHAEAYAIERLLVEAAFHHNREDFQQAIARATEAIQADADCGPAYSLRAASYWYTEHHVEAVDDYNKLLEMEEWPSFTSLSGRGQVYAEMGEFQSALDDLNRAIEHESRGVPPKTLAYALSGRALARAGLGRFEEAVQDFESSIRNCPANAWVHYNHGLMCHQLGKTDEAVVCFQLALELREPALPPRKRDRARGYVRRYRQAGTEQPGEGSGH
jgi:tetratricopeptide (TPR) repeat protein